MNNEIKVIIANDNAEEMAKTEEILTNRGFVVIGKATNGLQLETLICDNPQTDVVVLDIMLSGKDGFAIMEDCTNKHLPIKFIVTSVLNSDTFVQKALSLGAVYYMIKPVNPATIANRIADLYANYPVTSEKTIQKTKETKSARMLEERISNIFITVGIPAHIKGYQFLR